ncbi:gluconokinase [Massilia sp. CF038]|uniref:gluconokinase n=1 Tax=Massilia sp. CF038 TaxID=1881045 RepID=UPI00091A76FD|nr:gluconokinase [Massilia sp. CF038]SHH56752.1 gluconate kinase, SKI family [Massilia sp. CF038]
MQKHFVVMGVSGCGKTAVGSSLAGALKLPFVEGDQFHSAANVARMAAGIPLTDPDRAAWLAALQGELHRVTAGGSGVVLSCSSLKRRYRDILRAAVPGLYFIHLAGPRELIAARMRARRGHFMPATLLDSQLHDLEPLQSGEDGIVLSIEQSPQHLVDLVLALTHPASV